MSKTKSKTKKPRNGLAYAAKKLREIPEPRGRVLDAANGIVFYVDSDYSAEQWFAITDAMSRCVYVPERRRRMTEQTEQTNGTQEEAVSEFAPAWRPSAGDVITGTLVNVEYIDPSGQGPYPCVTLMTGDGERNIHAFHSVLRRELARRRPKIGDEITITYQGQKEGGKYGGYHAYRVKGGQGTEFDWDQELPAEERQARSQDVPIPPAPTPSQQQAEFPEPEPGSQFGAEPPF